jgi:hypothetical protein
LNSSHRKTFGLVFSSPASFDAYRLIGNKHGYTNPNPLKTTSKILKNENANAVQKNLFQRAARERKTTEKVEDSDIFSLSFPHTQTDRQR